MFSGSRAASGVISTAHLPDDLRRKVLEWVYTLFAHDQNQTQTILRAATAMGYGLDPEKYTSAYPGSTVNIVTGPLPPSPAAIVDTPPMPVTSPAPTTTPTPPAPKVEPVATSPVAVPVVVTPPAPPVAVPIVVTPSPQPTPTPAPVSGGTAAKLPTAVPTPATPRPTQPATVPKKGMPTWLKILGVAVLTAAGAGIGWGVGALMPRPSAPATSPATAASAIKPQEWQLKIVEP